MADEIETTATLAELVAERPELAGLFETLRIDYCCGGDQSLAEACVQRGLDAETVQAMLAAFDRVGASAATVDDRDWRQVALGELCDHITTVYHDGLRRDLPELAELITTVVRVHSADRPALVDLEQAFIELRGEIESHIEEEEGRLFPVMRELDGPNPPKIDPVWIDKHEDEHADVGAGLTRLRELADDYDASKALCSTHRLLFDRLARFEAEMHQHVHKENNILFPRARAHAASAPAAG